MSFAELNRQDDEENDRAERKAAGLKKPKVTNFPTRGDNKDLQLSSSQHEEFPFMVADRVRKTRPDLWKLGSPTSTLSFRNWKRVKDGDFTQALERWLRAREKWGTKHLSSDALTPANMMKAMKYGLQHEAGVEAMMNVLGLTATGLNLPDEEDTRAAEENEG